MARCLTHQCVVVPKAVNVAVAMFKDEAHHSTSGLGTDVLQVKNQIPVATLETWQNVESRVHDAQSLQLTMWFTFQHDHILTAERGIVRTHHTSCSRRSTSPS